MNQGSAFGAAVGVAHDDIALVHACKNGDVDASEQLVERYDSRLLRIAQHITHNREDAHRRRMLFKTHSSKYSEIWATFTRTQFRVERY